MTCRSTPSTRPRSGRSPATTTSRPTAACPIRPPWPRLPNACWPHARPLFVCGGGVVIAGASEALDALATLLNAPVCTTVSGQGSLADTHPLNAGVIGTNGGVPATRAVVEQADLVMFIGARAGSTTTEHWQMPARSTTILHLDVDAGTIATNYRTDVALVGDAPAGPAGAGGGGAAAPGQSPQ